MIRCWTILIVLASWISLVHSQSANLVMLGRDDWLAIVNQATGSLYSSQVSSPGNNFTILCYVNSNLIIGTTVSYSLIGFNPNNNSIMWVVNQTQPIRAIFYIPTSDKLATGGWGGGISIRQMSNMVQLMNYPGHAGYPINAVIWLTTDQMASSATDAKIYIWSKDNLATILSISSGSAAYSLVQLSYTTIAAGLASGMIKIFSLTDGSTLQSLTGHASTVSGLKSVDTFFLVSSDASGVLKSWYWPDGSQLSSIQAHNGPITGMDLSADYTIQTVSNVGSYFNSFTISPSTYSISLTNQILVISPAVVCSLNPMKPNITNLFLYLNSYWPINCADPQDKVTLQNLTSPQSLFASDRFGNSNGAIRVSNSTSTAYWQAPAGVYFSSQSTITAWVIFYTNPSGGRFFDFGVGYVSNNVLLCPSANDGAGKGYLYFQGYCGSSSVVPTYNAVGPLNTWYHLAIVLSGSTVNIYLNATLVTTYTMCGAMNSVTRTTNYFGKSNWNGNPYLQADFDEIRIYSKALSQQDVLLDMQTQFKLTQISTCEITTTSNETNTITTIPTIPNVIYNLSCPSLTVLTYTTSSCQLIANLNDSNVLTASNQIVYTFSGSSTTISLAFTPANKVFTIPIALTFNGDPSYTLSIQETLYNQYNKSITFTTSQGSFFNIKTGIDLAPVFYQNYMITRLTNINLLSCLGTCQRNTSCMTAVFKTSSIECSLFNSPFTNSDVLSTSEPINVYSKILDT